MATHIAAFVNERKSQVSGNLVPSCEQKEREARDGLFRLHLSHRLETFRVLLDRNEDEEE